MASDDIRLTQPTLKVLRTFVEKPRESFSGAQIHKATRVGPGTLYPILARLENAGWLTSEWENVDPREAGRPRRRFYKLTGGGYARARSALADLQVPEGHLVWIS